MPKIDLKVIKGTENLVLPHIPKRYSPQIEQHPNISIITFMADKSSSDFAHLLTALSVTDQTTSLNLYKRDWRVATVAAGINPSLACIMCELAKVSPKDIVLDPFAGAGVIPISSIKYYGAKQAIAADISGFAINATRKNATAAGVTKQLEIIHSAIGDLKLKPKSITKIISNLPFGIRTGHHATNPAIYSDLLHKSIKLLKPKGLVVLLSQELKLIKQVFSDESFKLIVDLHLSPFAKNRERKLGDESEEVSLRRDSAPDEATGRRYPGRKPAGASFHSGLQPHIFIYQKTI